MTTENRGGPRVPDGVQRPASLPFVRGPNRTDMSELPGTPGTPLPPAPGEPTIPHGKAQHLRRMLQGIPLDQVAPPASLTDASMTPDEPVTAGVDVGAGPGSSSLFPAQSRLNNQETAAQMRVAYPLIMRLATLPNATTETKILAQRIRANLPVSPEQMPVMEPSDGIRR